MKDSKRVITVKLHVVGYNETLKKELFIELRSNMRKVYENSITMEFVRSEKYWKIPEHTICFFKVFLECDCLFVLQDIIKSLGLENVKYFFDEDGSREEIVWASLANKESFLHPNVKWAHIYTWSE